MDPLAERLRRERERQGRSLRELSAETKIREPFLEALENGQYNVLPAVYVRSFIRTAAAALHIPAADITRLMNEAFDPDEDESTRLPASQHATSDKPQAARHVSQYAPTSSVPTEPTRINKGVPDQTHKSHNSNVNQYSRRNPNSRGWLDRIPTALRSPVGVAILVLAIIALAVLVWVLFFRTSGDGSQNTRLDADSVLDVSVSPVNGDPSGQGSGIAITDSMVLTAVVRDTAWINITSDEKRTQQLVVLPGGDYRWSAMEKFVLSISNAGAVTFSRNGMELKPFGKNGEVVRSVTITRTDVKSSATVIRPPTKPAPAAERPLITPAPPQKIDPAKRSKPEALPRR